MKRLLELQNKKAGLVNDAQKIMTKAEDESRELTAEERGQVDRMLDEVTALDTQIADEKRSQRVSTAVADLDNVDTEVRGGMIPHDQHDETETRIQAREAYLTEFRQYLMNAEVRATLVQGTDNLGGYTCPDTFVNKLITALGERFPLISMCNVYRLHGSNKVVIPKITSEPAEPTLTTETGTGSETNPAFGEITLDPYPIAERIKMSNSFLRMTAINIEDEIIKIVANKFAKKMERYLLNGTGSSQPTGIFGGTTAITTGQDVSDGNTATAIKADSIRAAFATLEDGYRMNAVWVFHPDVYKALFLLKDGNGQYMISPGMSSGGFTQLLTRPVLTSSVAPNTMTTGQYVGAFFDPQQLYVALWQDFSVQILKELYAEANSTGYIFRAELDCYPGIEDGFVRIKLG